MQSILGAKQRGSVPGVGETDEETSREGIVAIVRFALEHGRELLRVADRDERATSESRHREHARRFRHLRTLVQNGDGEREILHGVVPARGGRDPDHAAFTQRTSARVRRPSLRRREFALQHARSLAVVASRNIARSSRA